MSRLHPYLGIPLPDAVWRLADHIRDVGWEPVAAAFGTDPAPWLYEADTDPALTLPGFPLELVPLTSGPVYYGLVVHDPSVPSACASWAQGDDDACWLGDSALEGIAHLVGVGVRDTALYAGDDEETAGYTHAAAAALAAALGIAIPTALDDLDSSARSDRLHQPPVPPGWMYEECNDGIGVLAPVSAFDPSLVHPDAIQVFDLAAELALADDLLARGFPGSALAEARNTLHFLALDPERVLPLQRVIAAYEALGRPHLARRARSCLAAWTD